jgi:hypothetical protein
MGGGPGPHSLRQHLGEVGRPFESDFHDECVCAERYLRNDCGARDRRRAVKVNGRVVATAPASVLDPKTSGSDGFGYRYIDGIAAGSYEMEIGS